MEKFVVERKVRKVVILYWGFVYFIVFCVYIELSIRWYLEIYKNLILVKVWN